jgi:hypothetical protein
MSRADNYSAFEEIDAELLKAERHQPNFVSLHEAYAVILEEVDELWEIARQKRKDRSSVAIQKELVQIAAMAVKALHSMSNFVGGSV